MPSTFNSLASLPLAVYAALFTSFSSFPSRSSSSSLYPFMLINSLDTQPHIFSPIGPLLPLSCAFYLLHWTAFVSWCAAAPVLCSSRWLTWFLWSLMLPLSLAPSLSVTSPLRPCPPSPPRTPPLPPHPVLSILENWCVKTQTPHLKPRGHRPIKSERIVARGSACQMWNYHPRYDV